MIPKISHYSLLNGHGKFKLYMCLREHVTAGNPSHFGLHAEQLLFFQIAPFTVHVTWYTSDSAPGDGILYNPASRITSVVPVY